MAAYDTIAIDRKGFILTITLNKPKKKNAIDFKTYTELTSALTDSISDSSIHAVILTGAGDYFTSGADLTESVNGYYINSMKDPVTAPVGKFMLTLLHYPKLIVAAVNGPAVGIGVTLLVHCDLCYASTSANFWTPFARVALVPEFCSSVTFPKIFGPSMATEMLLGLKVASVEEAMTAGLVSAVFPPDVLLQKVHNKIHEIFDQPLAEISVPLFKKVIRRPVLAELESVFRDEMAEIAKRSEKGETAKAIRMLMGGKRGGADAARSKL